MVEQARRAGLLAQPGMGAPSLAVARAAADAAPSVLTVPLVVDGRVTGLLAVESATVDRFREDEAGRLQQFADRWGPTLERARLSELERVRRGRISALAQARGLLAGSADTKEVLTLAGEAAVPRLVPWCAVLLPAEGTGLRTVYTRHMDEAWSPALSWLLDRASEKAAGAKGRPGEWAPGDYRVRAGVVVCAGGVIGTTSLLLRSPLPLPRRVGEGFTCHPALILVAEHGGLITNDVGHPKSYFVDRGAEQRFVLETCMYFPFTTAKALSGFGPDHTRVMRAFPRLQMILVLACDAATPGNRITVDGAGRPVAHYHFMEETVAGLVEGTRAAARIFFAAGAVRVHAPFADPPLIDYLDANRVILLAEGFALHETDFRERPHLFGHHMFARIGLGAFLTAADYVVVEVEDGAPWPPFVIARTWNSNG